MPGGASSVEGAAIQLMEQSVVVTHRGETRAASGHPWIYKSDVAEVTAGAGAIVRVYGPRKRLIGHILAL